jgi:hypothetical protein
VNAKTKAESHCGNLNSQVTGKEKDEEKVDINIKHGDFSL